MSTLSENLKTAFPNKLGSFAFTTLRKRTQSFEIFIHYPKYIHIIMTSIMLFSTLLNFTILSIFRFFYLRVILIAKLIPNKASLQYQTSSVQYKARRVQQKVGFKYKLSFKPKQVYNAKQVYNNKKSKNQFQTMFCNNLSYETQRNDKNCSKYCSPTYGMEQRVSYNYLPTQKSQRNPSNLYSNNLSTREKQEAYQQNYRQTINIGQNLELIDPNTRRQNKIEQAIDRNKNIASIISIILAFSERIQALKQKICGYPAQSFSPAQFFNVLDLTEKGFVDIYDVKRFINNEKIRQKDIISLFKKVNGDHAKDSSRLTYFGYLNLIKPYFNQQLAKDVLMRDTIVAKQSKKKKNRDDGSNLANQLIEPTQQSVLLLFQELVLLHCICSTEHQQAKQLLMNQYMLNTQQIKQIMGLNFDEGSSPVKNNSSTSKSHGRNLHKSSLSTIYEFIQNNSKFQIGFQQMKFLLSYFNVHQFSIPSDKCLASMFLPTNCKKQLLNQIQKKNQTMQKNEGSQRYMNTYLTKQNLMNRGNIQMIKQYLNQKDQYRLSSQHLTGLNHGLGNSKPNFLEFVHPRSIQRPDLNYQNMPANMQQLTQFPGVPPYVIANEHPHILINASNKYLSQGANGHNLQAQYSHRSKQLTNNSSIPQQNIKVNPPRQNIINNAENYRLNGNNYGLNGDNYRSKGDNYGPNAGNHGPNGNSYALKGEFYQENEQNTSNLSKTPFLEQFMKESNIIKNIPKYDNANHRKTKLINPNQSALRDSSHISDSAFQIIDYGYQRESKQDNFHSDKKKGPYKSVNQQIEKGQSLDSRYNLVISQYRDNGQNNKRADMNKNLNPSNQINLFKIEQGFKYSQDMANGNTGGAKYQKSFRNPQTQNKIFDYSGGNYIDAVGISQSKMINDSNLRQKNKMGLQNVSANESRNILDDFLIK